ncbi:S4 domain-containing protein YaaA [Terrilactibacillus sp. BCM23-1]|uniref:S4 domain-containing protein YaaA n=1 Tax=Terrilactibacillus tamarindi TaxID=2599694 RepID=A0A6N8CNA9_9BACI|nr:S4 domain-containing protein YaaA [Terrilactibacillus tamarindi]MTT31050.1 S4 domain-containing protein YaaA [Terrilactibacillus tamarindi]
MSEIQLNPGQEFMTLGQLLKIAGVIGTGGQAKWFLSEYAVIVNDEPETRRGRKLYEGDRIEIEGQETFVIQKP